MRLLFVSLTLAAWGRAEGEPSASHSQDEALRKACAYLWNHQADDGGWHSDQYAVLRSGQTLTPFVLHTLLGSIDAMSSDETGRVLRAVKFIRQHVDEDGSIGRADPDILEYPVYSTAYAVICLKRVQAYRHLRSEENERLIARMEAYLVAAQFDETDGFTTEEDVAYGGWGFDAPRREGEPGHMDLAHTRRAIQAIRAARWLHNPHDNWIKGEAKIQVRAQAFLRVVQRHPKAAAQPEGASGRRSIPMSSYDGGFYFSPVVLTANKGRADEKDGAKYFRSYATATCDGILALLACGVNRSDERVVRAVEWLREHDDLTYPQGVPAEHPEPWGEAIRFYHFAVRAEAYAALNWPADWRTSLAAAVAQNQASDGSFRNTVSPLMKEDDPLLCTALATIALTHCDSGISE